MNSAKSKLSMNNVFHCSQFYTKDEPWLVVDNKGNLAISNVCLIGHEQLLILATLAKVPSVAEGVAAALRNKYWPELLK